MNKTIMPAVFIGHGSPTNAIENNIYTQAWQKLGQQLPRPSAILCISAHWYNNQSAVSDSQQPKLIYDFYGFPNELYQIAYPAKGSPELAQQIKKLLAHLTTVKINNDWGIDHGTWVPLLHIFPQADIPVVQLSINRHQPASFHYQLGQALQPLREQGVLIIGSGNLVHNLNYIDFSETTKPYSWAKEFDALALRLIDEHNHQQLIDFKSLGSASDMSIPIPDHYLPLLYILGLQQANEKLISIVDGFSYKSISMRSFILETNKKVPN